MQLLRPLFVFALLAYGFLAWLLGPMGGWGAIGGFVTFWLMLGLGYGYWLGLNPETDKMVHDLMVWISEKKKAEKAARSKVGGQAE